MDEKTLDDPQEPQAWGSKGSQETRSSQQGKRVFGETAQLSWHFLLKSLGAPTRQVAAGGCRSACISPGETEGWEKQLGLDK